MRSSSGILYVSLLSPVVWALCIYTVESKEPDDQSQAAIEVSWHTDYADAIDAARERNKMLFVFFSGPNEDDLSNRFESKVLAETEVAEKLQDYVCVKVPLEAKIRVKGEELVLLEHSSFQRLQGGPGVTILDFLHKDAPYYGYVVGALPLADIDCSSTRQTSILLDLPPGPLQQRMDCYAAEVSQSDTPADEVVAKAAEDEVEQEPDAGESESWTASGWHTDYADAVKEAKQQEKMLLVRFYGSRLNLRCRRFDRETLSDPRVREKLPDYVCVRLPLAATVEAEGHTAPMCNHPAFAEMFGKPGVAILDFVDSDSELYGRVVSTFPITRDLRYTPEQMLVILGLPRATLTQRTLIYAVRIHPEKPASTEGQIDENLLKEAESHSAYQARIRLQGHHHWERRFHQISAKLPSGLTAVEVCAESWPGEGLVEAAIECVRCWRFSSGHWSAVRARHRFYGYDMRRGSNRIWYGTGIFGGE